MIYITKNNKKIDIDTDEIPSYMFLNFVCSKNLKIKSKDLSLASYFKEFPEEKEYIKQKAIFFGTDIEGGEFSVSFDLDFYRIVYVYGSEVFDEINLDIPFYKLTNKYFVTKYTYKKIFTRLFFLGIIKEYKKKKCLFTYFRKEDN